MSKYPITKCWRPEDIRKAIKKRKLFPTDNSAKKVIYLAIQDASKKWTMSNKKLEISI